MEILRARLEKHEQWTLEFSNNTKNDISDLQNKLSNFVTISEFEIYKEATNASINDHTNEIQKIWKAIADLVKCDTFDTHLVDYNNLKNIVIGLTKGEK